jgi:hypothetical protein
MEDGNIKKKAGFPDEVGEFSETVMKSTVWEPHPVYIMDVADVEGVGLKVMEIGSANCAGIYHMDVRKLLTALAEVAVEDYVP